MDKIQANGVWMVLDRAITEIYSKNASQLSFEELYRNAYNLTLHKHGSLLYTGVQRKISLQLQSMNQRLSDASEEELLRELTEVWCDHRICMVMIRDILMYMDRTYVPAQRKRPIYELGLYLFRLKVWEGICARVSRRLLEAVADERAGRSTGEEVLIQPTLAMLLELGRCDGSDVYRRDFEEAFLGSTQEFYRNEALAQLSRGNACEYVAVAARRLEEEAARAARCLAPSTEGPLRRTVEAELLERHAATLVSEGFAPALAEGNVEAATAYYKLFSRIPSTVERLRDALADRVRSDGSRLPRDDPHAFVTGVLRLRRVYTDMVCRAFNNETKATTRLRTAFEDFLNVDGVTAARCLGVYVDDLLRHGTRKTSTAASAETTTNGTLVLEEELKNVIVVFRYLSDKDVFEAFYKQFLAKRLLSGKSVGDDAERAMVSLLKAECGYQFTSKLEGMFNDMRISRDTRDAYRRYVDFRPLLPSSASDSTQAQHQSHKIDLDVDVLTTGYWPSGNAATCNLPPAITAAVAHFTEFYLEKHTGRKLRWQTSTGSADVRAIYSHSNGENSSGKRRHHHDLCVSTYQMCLLLLFNERDTYSLAELREATAIPDAELRRHLISLCTPKHRILKKGSRGKSIVGDADTFTYNPDYKCRLTRVKVPLVSMKETATTASGPDNASAKTPANARETADELPPAVEEARRHQVEAAVVRIMKARKVMVHNDLIAETTRQLSGRFVPPPQFVKKRIESLIEREYVERDAKDRKKYIYMA